MKNKGNIHHLISKGKIKSLSFLLLLAVQMLPLYSFGQQGFTHQSFGNDFEGGFSHQAFGYNSEGDFSHQGFGNNIDDNFSHQGFGNNVDVDFSHQGFGNNMEGGFGHQPFGNDAPLGSGLLILLSVGVGYAVLNSKQQDESNH